MALVVVVVVLLFLILNWYVAPTKPSERKDLVLAVAQILGGTALLSGLYFTWRTLKVNREGQITERFTRAIDQLGAADDQGNKLLEVRITSAVPLDFWITSSKSAGTETVGCGISTTSKYWSLSKAPKSPRVGL